jgi:hypothetical protein
MRKSNLSETNHTHVGIDKLENALRGKDHPHSQPNQHDARGTCSWLEEKQKG